MVKEPKTSIAGPSNVIHKSFFPPNTQMLLK